MCQSPKIENGVYNLFFSSVIHIFGQFFVKNFELPYFLNAES